MRIPFSLLKKYLKTDANLEQICKKLTAIGLEVEEVIYRKDLEDFIVAKIVDFEKHPNADKLNVCKVDNGNEILQIVCGAPNVKNDMKVVLAPIDALIPRDNFKIKQAKIRDVDSCGMMCSASELLLNDDAEGIVELSNDFEIGKSYAEQAGLNDPIIEVNLTPNRGDCASVYGIARDLSAAKIGEIQKFKVRDFISEAKKNNDFIKIETDLCGKFGIIKINNVKNVQSPLWIRSELEKFKINPKNILVDITNYVMMVFGQPMHCYDADKVYKNIFVRKSKKKYDFASIKEESVSIDISDIIIEDEKNILALAGIIGGKDSAINNNTTNIILEAAYFDKDQIAKTGQRSGIITDSRFRFERGCDPEMIEFALNFATKTILDICDGSGVEFVDVKTEKIIEKNKIEYDFSFIKKLCNVDVESEKQLEILKELGFLMSNISKTNCIIESPSWRHDLFGKADIAEEILRINGYDKLIQQAMPCFEVLDFKERNIYEIELKTKKLSSSLGFDELISFSFQKNDLADLVRYDVSKNLVKIKNPISDIHSNLKQSLLTGLFDDLIGNFNKNKNCNVNVFEFANVYFGCKEEEQRKNLAFLSYGKNSNADYTNSQESSSWFRMKCVLLLILKNIFGIQQSDLSFSSMKLDFCHGFRSFYVVYNGKNIACFGEFNPIFLDKYSIKEIVSFAEIFDFNSIEAKNILKVDKITNLQNIFREFSFIIEDNVKIGDVLLKINKLDSRIKNVFLVNIYKDEILPKKTSYSFKIEIFQDEQMKNEEIDLISNSIIDVVTKEFNGKLKDGK